MITYQLCNSQYVGKTINGLHARFSKHRTASSPSQLNSVIYRHFLNDGHSAHHCKLQIIYHYDKEDDNANKTLLTVEELCMRKIILCIILDLMTRLNP